MDVLNKRFWFGCVREPLLHFLILGAALFLLFSQVRDKSIEAPESIMVTRGQIGSLIENWQRVWQRPPTPQELDGLIEDYVREEVFYREALAMGLDRDDTIIRRRLRQKLEFITDDLVGQVEPTDAELQAFLAKNPELFEEDATLSFHQVFLDPARRGSALKGDAERLLVELNASGADALSVGDPLLLPPDYKEQRVSEIAALFGDEFAASLLTLEVGKWQGPVKSSYGQHLVFIGERADGRLPDLATIRDKIEREWATVRRREASEAFYQQLRNRYAITIEPLIDSGGDGSIALEAKP